MDKYYLKINVIQKNGKRYFHNCELCKNNKVIKTYDRDISKQINKLAKKNNIYIVSNKNSYIIDDIDFIKKHIGIPSKKVLHINKYAGMIATISTLALGTLTLSAIDQKYNSDLYNDTSISNDIDDDDIMDDKMLVYDTGSDEELNIDTNMIYYPKEEIKDEPHIIIFGDKEEKLEESTNEFDVVSSIDDIDDSYIYEFDSIDHSSDDSVRLVDLVYGPYIKPITDKYGDSYELILADICQENKDFTIRNSTNGGVGPLQVEWYIWDGKSLPDIDGTNYTFNCNELNNISDNFDLMFKVSIYKQLFEDKNLSKEQLESNINTYLDIIKNGKFPNGKLIDYEATKNQLNSYINIIESTSSIQEAQEQTLNYFGITNENIKQYNNAIEGVHAGLVILTDNITTINRENSNNLYNYKLSNCEEGIFAFWAQNKGITTITNCLKVTNDLHDSEWAIKVNDSYGDDSYPSNVFSYLPSDNVVHLTTRDGNIISIKPRNIEKNIQK